MRNAALAAQIGSKRRILVLASRLAGAQTRLLTSLASRPATDNNDNINGSLEKSLNFAAIGQQMGFYVLVD